MRLVWFLIVAGLLVVILGFHAYDLWRQNAGRREVTAAVQAVGESAPVVSPQPSPQPAVKATLPKTVKTRNGKIYDNVKLFRAEPDGLMIIYYGPASKGIAKVAFTDLPDDICRAFNYDSAKAEKFKADRLASANPVAARPQAQASTTPAVFPTPSRPASAASRSIASLTNMMRIDPAIIAEIEASDPELAAAIRMVEASRPNLSNLPVEMPAIAREWYNAYCQKVRSEADAKMAENARRMQELMDGDREPTNVTYVTNPKTGVVYPIYPLCIPTNNWGKR